jgi:deoxyribodipyrimidine photolyase-related protein
MSTNDLLLILGNQLFPIEHIKKTKVKKVFMAEDFGLTTYHKHHKLKILMFLWAMRQYRDELVENGYTVYYYSIEDKNFKISYEDKLLAAIKKYKIEKINYFEIEDHFFEDNLNKFIIKNKIKTKLIQNPMFLLSRAKFVEFAHTQKNLIRMASFYQKMRIKMSILIDENTKPIGGKWSYDEENRKKIPQNINIPEKPSLTNNNDINDLKNKINLIFKDHPGSADYLWMPTNRQEALKWMDKFFKTKFHNFGIYEDAIIDNNNFLFHSALSPIVNMGLLTPDEIIQKAVKFSKQESIPLNSLEGFIRQIIGWREFIRGIYHYKGREEKKSNFWQHNRRLTSDWYEGTTGIKPLDDVIKDCLKYGYTHHIPRLMIICNIMNLCRIHPDEIYKWFMEMFVDSSDWVMVPNVYGMGTFADGGIFATKPYSCGSNYILKMSNYKRGDWCEIVDGLYWKFMSDNLSFFKSNHRLSILVRSLDKMNKVKKDIIFQKATKFIESKTS